jgi:hypothetical protein
VTSATLSIVRDGMRRVNAAPAVIVGVLAATLAVATPATVAMHRALAGHFGVSLAAERAAAGVNFDWWQEFSGGASGFAATFKPSIIGFAAVLRNLSTIADNEPLEYAAAVLAACYIGVWVFLTGGIVDRYARDRRTRAIGFFAACGQYFFRVLKLAAIGGVVYYLLFAYVHGWLLVNLYGRLTHDVAIERTGFLIRVGLYLAFGLLLLTCNLVLDYAKVRTVVEDRGSVLGAIFAGTRFVWRHAGSTAAVYGLLSLAFVVLITIYALVAPGAGSTGLSMWIGLLVGQAYIVARLWLKLVFIASQTSLFQQQLAHAGYAAAPEYVWPESPDIERLINAARRDAAQMTVGRSGQ